MSSDVLLRSVNSAVSRRAFCRSAGVGLGAAALVPTLAACTKDVPDAKQPKGVGGAEQIQLGPDVKGVLYPDGYVGPRASEKKPFHDGSKTFRVVVQQDPATVGDWNENAFSQWLEQRTGLKVEYQAVLTLASDGNADLTKINAIIASGELPDAFLNIPFTDDQLSLYGSQGLFQPVQDYVETYAPEMRRAMADYPDLRALTTAKDGNVYQFRGVNDCYHCRVSPSRAYINKNYLDKVGADLPETTDDLRKVLKLFKDKDPSPKGGLMPFGASLNNPIDNYIMNAFLYNPGGDAAGGWLSVREGKVEFVADKDEWRQGLEFLRSLYDDGTLTREAFTMTDEQYQKLGNQGRIGFARAYTWGSFLEVKYEEGALWKDYVPLPPLKGPAGVQYAGWDHFLFLAERMVITNACSNPELLIQWADYQMELEAVLRAYAGKKDDAWNYAKEGEAGINSKQAVWEQPGSNAEGHSWGQQSTMYRSNDFRLAQFIDAEHPNFEKDLFEATKVYEPFAQPKEMQLPPLIFNESGAAQKADTAVSVEMHVTQSLAKFATGGLDIHDDKAWQDYQDKFEAMGLPQYLELYQKAYDERPQ